MTTVYLDTNALVKLYLRDANSQRVHQLVQQWGGVSTSVITYPEARGVFAKLRARETISERKHDELLPAFEADWPTIALIDLTPVVYRRAGDLITAHPKLRGMDAIHLASALEARLDVDIRFLTFDADLQTVAERLLYPHELG